jgi:hypothetical protein
MQPRYGRQGNIQKCCTEASWKTKNMAGNGSLIKGGWNWLRTISNSRGWFRFGYLSSVTQLKPAYCL